MPDPFISELWTSLKAARTHPGIYYLIFTIALSMIAFEAKARQLDLPIFVYGMESLAIISSVLGLIVTTSHYWNSTRSKNVPPLSEPSNSPMPEAQPWGGSINRNDRATKQSPAGATNASRIHLDPGLLVGKPIIRGTRLSVEFIIELLAIGWNETEILENYPGLEPADITACLVYAHDCLTAEKIFPVAA